VSSIGPGTTFGSYRIESTLGRGGMSVVYLAEDPRLARQVAITTMPSRNPCLTSGYALGVW
jgi:hypothetical protein